MLGQEQSRTGGEQKRTAEHAEDQHHAAGARAQSELVRLGGSGYLRRGSCYAVYSLESDVRVSIPVQGTHAALAWGSPSVSSPRPGVTQVDFAEPGVVFLVP